jgi:flagellar basal-body rod protein FlgB
MDATGFQIDVLARLLDASALRHRVIANNVANINTPNFKRLDVSFEEDLTKAMANKTSPFEVQPKIVEDNQSPPRADGNTVDIDREMNALLRNSVLFESAAQILSSRISSLRTAIKGS